MNRITVQLIHTWFLLAVGQCRLESWMEINNENNCKIEIMLTSCVGIINKKKIQ